MPVKQIRFYSPSNTQQPESVFGFDSYHMTGKHLSQKISLPRVFNGASIAVQFGLLAPSLLESLLGDSARSEPWVRQVGESQDGYGMRVMKQMVDDWSRFGPLLKGTSVYLGDYTIGDKDDGMGHNCADKDKFVECADLVVRFMIIFGKKGFLRWEDIDRCNRKLYKPKLSVLSRIFGFVGLGKAFGTSEKQNKSNALLQAYRSNLEGEIEKMNQENIDENIEMLLSPDGLQAAKEFLYDSDFRREISNISPQHQKALYGAAQPKKQGPAEVKHIGDMLRYISSHAEELKDVLKSEYVEVGVGYQVSLYDLMTGKSVRNDAMINPINIEVATEYIDQKRSYSNPAADAEDDFEFDDDENEKPPVPQKSPRAQTAAQKIIDQKRSAEGMATGGKHADRVKQKDPARRWLG